MQYVKCFPYKISFLSSKMIKINFLVFLFFFLRVSGYKSNSLQAMIEILVKLPLAAIS